MERLGQLPAHDQTDLMIVDLWPLCVAADSHRPVSECAMNLLPYLVGLAGTIALVLTLLLTHYCLLLPSGPRIADPDAFFHPDHFSGTAPPLTQANRSARIPTISRFSSALLFRRTQG